jgi:hypothetical protein
MLNTVLNKVSNSVWPSPRSTDGEKNHWPNTPHSQRGLVARECTMPNSTSAAKIDPAQRQGCRAGTTCRVLIGVETRTGRAGLA